MCFPHIYYKMTSACCNYYCHYCHSASNSSCRFCSAPAPGAFVTPKRTSDCLEENVCLSPTSGGKVQWNPSGSPWPQFCGICTSFIASRKNYSYGEDRGNLRALCYGINWGGAVFMASYRILLTNWRASFGCRRPERNMDAVMGFSDVTPCVSATPLVTQAT
jgi:hypothetical protein